MSIFTATGLNVLTHGWSGLAFAYAMVEVPLVAGLVRGRAQVHKLLLSPLLAAPLTAAAGIGMAISSPLFRGLGLAGDELLQLGAGVGLSVTLGYVIGQIVARARPSASLHQRGTVIEDIESSSNAHQGTRARARERGNSWEGQGHDHPITLAGLPLSVEDETKHFKLIGTTGTGKSTAIRELLTGALRRGDRAVIADPDGGYLEKFYDPRRGDVILNPFDRRSAKWDLYGEIADAYDIEQLGRSLIPDQDGSDRSWRAYARTFFNAVTRATHAGGVKDVAELYRLLAVANTTELKILVAGTPAQPFLESQNGRMFDSIRSVASSALGALEYVGKQKAELFSIRQWVQQGATAAGGRSRAGVEPDGELSDGSHSVLFVPYQAGQIAALRSTISAWMRLAIFEAMNQREAGDQRLWFVVDELDALGQIDGLKDALARLRKFGGRCVLGFQSVAQVSSTYGSGEAQTIVENCSNTLILRCSSSEHGGTAGFASRLIGQHEIARTTVSRSRRLLQLFPSITRSEHFSIEPAIMDSQIEQLPDLKGFLKRASRPEWRHVSLRPPAAMSDGGMADRVREQAGRFWTRLRASERIAAGADDRKDAAVGTVRESSVSRDGFER